MDQVDPLPVRGVQGYLGLGTATEAVCSSTFTRSERRAHRSVYTETAQTFYSKETRAAILGGDHGFSGSVQVNPSSVGLPPKALVVRTIATRPGRRNGPREAFPQNAGNLKY